MSQSTVIARIGKPHGLHGEVTVQLHTDEPERRLAVGTAIDTEAATGTGVPRALTVRSTRVHNGVWLVAFEEIPDRTGAESLRGTRLVVDAADVLPADDEDDVFTEEQLRGLTVVDPAGTVLGSGRRARARRRPGPARHPAARRPRGAGAVRRRDSCPRSTSRRGRVVVDAPPGLLDLGV